MPKSGKAKIITFIPCSEAVAQIHFSSQQHTLFFSSLTNQPPPNAGLGCSKEHKQHIN